MSIDYQSERERHLVLVTLSRVVNGRMLSDLQSRLQNDRRIERGFNELIDLTPMEYLDFETSLSELGNLVIPDSVDPTPCRVALVPSRHLYAKILEDHLIPQKRSQARVEALDDMGQARSWVSGEIGSGGSVEPGSRDAGFRKERH